jgi:MFS family permease
MFRPRLTEPHAAPRGAPEDPRCESVAEPATRPAPGPADTFGRCRVLIAVCVLGAVVGAVALPAIGIGAARELSPQLTALAPLGLFHDLRWLFVYHDSWLSFGLGAVALIAFRATFTAVVVRLAWPADRPRPSLRRTWLSALIYTLVAGALLSPMVALLFGVGVIPFSWPWLAAVPTAVIVAVIVHHGGLVGHWWRRLPTARSVGWLLLDVLVLTATALTISAAPAWLAWLPAALGGLFNAWAWYGATDALVHRRPARWPHLTWPVPVTPVTAVLVLVVIVVGAKGGFALAAVPQHATPSAARASGGEPVLVAGGFGSACCSKAASIGGGDQHLSAQQFSYAGLTASGQPIPQSPSATHAPLPVLAERMAAQVRRLHRASGHDVAIVAESEGSLVTLAYLHRHPHAPVDDVALLSPIVDPGRVSYPAAGRQGFGLAAGWELRGVTGAIGRIAPFAVSASGPLLRSIDTSDGSLSWSDLCRRGLRTVAFVPLADSVTLPTTLEADSPVPIVVVPAFHGGLLGNPKVQHAVRSWLAGKPLPSKPALTATSRVLTGAASAWRVPPLVTDFHSARTATAKTGCAAVS